MSSYTPMPGSNIALIYELIGDDFITAADLHKSLQKKHPSFPIASVSTHARFLKEKGLIETKDGKYRRLSSVEETNSNKPISLQTLEYCKARIGKKITAKEATEVVSPDNLRSSGPATNIRILADSGFLQEIAHTVPRQFLVLPEIKTIDRISRRSIKSPKQELSVQTKSVQKANDIANLSIGEILSEFVNLKQENTMLREALQRIAHELQKVGEVE